MNWLPSFSTWQFAAAGLGAATVTILIHVITRRRYRLVNWGAMEFLREALSRSRRVIQLRDALLLALRTAAVFLFGLALARPHFSQSEDPVGLRPVHAILVIDNSLSMSYETLDGSRLDRARRAAIQVVERLPKGSQISVVAACDLEAGMSSEPVAAPAAAVGLINRIEAVDRTATLPSMLAAAHNTPRAAADYTRTIIVLTDQQRVAWEAAEPKDEQSAATVQIVDVAPEAADNAWVASVALQDRFAVPGVVTRVIASIERRGGTTRRDVDVALSVDGHVVASRAVALEAGTASASVSFEYTFDPLVPDGGSPEYLAVSVSITPDRLRADDVRHLMVPVFASFPILFVDQMGRDEEVQSGRVGETRSVRRLLGTSWHRVSGGAELSHTSFEELTPEMLQGKRLALIAGCRSPAMKVGMLREFAEGGGQLLIAAGGEFDPTAWTEFGWLDGGGILPAPLTNDPLGATPGEGRGTLFPFHLAAEELAQHAYFHVPGSSRAQLQTLFREPFFFKVIQVEEPHLPLDPRATVIVRFANEQRSPFVIERQLGRGKTVFLSSGLSSDWNTLPLSNAMVMIDRLVRSLVAETVAPQTFEVQPELKLPLTGVSESGTVLVQRPGRDIAVPVALVHENGQAAWATIERPFTRGLYQVRPARRSGPASPASWSIDFAVNGPDGESDLTKADEHMIAHAAKPLDIQFVESGEAVSVHAARRAGQQLWLWLTIVVLLLSFAELLVMTTFSHPAHSPATI